MRVEEIMFVCIYIFFVLWIVIVVEDKWWVRFEVIRVVFVCFDYLGKDFLVVYVLDL